MSPYRLDRRQFMTRVGMGLGLSPVFIQAEAEALSSSDPPPDRILLLLQLDGGNDGLSTVIPYGDPAYHRARKMLRFQEAAVLRNIERKIDGYLGWHPELGQLGRLFQEGEVAIVQGAGYPNPNRSHFKSLDIWHAASLRGRKIGSGWLGRLADLALSRQDEDQSLLIHVGKNTPFALQGQSRSAVSFESPLTYRWRDEDLEIRARDQASLCESRDEEVDVDPSPYTGRDAALEKMRRVHQTARESSRLIQEKTLDYAPKVDYPKLRLAGSLATIASLICGGLRARIYSTSLQGFDTHVDQRPRHDRLMVELDRSLGAFLADLRAQGQAGKVVVLAYSEFGRRVAPNGSRGTDHGVAGPMFVIGEPVRGGIKSPHPSLERLDEGDLVPSIDFRSIYASILDQWFGVDHRLILSRTFETLDLFDV